jgi:hypothetical protein
VDADVVEQLSDRFSICSSSSKVLLLRNTAPTTPARVRAWRPIITFSSADRFTNSRMFWNVRPMPAAATWCAFSPASAPPSKVNPPASGG